MAISDVQCVWIEGLETKGSEREEEDHFPLFGEQ